MGADEFLMDIAILECWRGGSQQLSIRESLISSTYLLTPDTFEFGLPSPRGSARSQVTVGIGKFSGWENVRKMSRIYQISP
jgi:hypothetical protein